MTMDRETIIKLAREADRYASKQTNDSYDWQEIRDEHFAKLVAEHSASVEREACAKAADVEADEWGSNSDGCYASRNIAAAIRARSNK